MFDITRLFSTALLPDEGSILTLKGEKTILSKDWNCVILFLPLFWVPALCLFIAELLAGRSAQIISTPDLKTIAAYFAREEWLCRYRAASSSSSKIPYGCVSWTASDLRRICRATRHFSRLAADVVGISFPRLDNLCHLCQTILPDGSTESIFRHQRVLDWMSMLSAAEWW